METFADQIKNIINEKIFLYENLAKLLEDETRCLLKTDIKSLWSIVRKKTDMALHIEKTRDRILICFSENSIDHKMNSKSFNMAKIISISPEKTREFLIKSNTRLLSLKSDISIRTSQNSDYVKECLSTIDNLFSIIIDNRDDKPSYGNQTAGIKQMPANFIFKARV